MNSTRASLTCVDKCITAWGGSGRRLDGRTKHICQILEICMSSVTACNDSRRKAKWDAERTEQARLNGCVRTCVVRTAKGGLFGRDATPLLASVFSSACSAPSRQKAAVSIRLNHPNHSQVTVRDPRTKFKLGPCLLSIASQVCGWMGLKNMVAGHLVRVCAEHTTSRRDGPCPNNPIEFFKPRKSVLVEKLTKKIEIILTQNNNKVVEGAQTPSSSCFECYVWNRLARALQSTP